MKFLEKRYNLLEYCDVYTSNTDRTNRMKIITDLPTDTYTITATESPSYPSGSGIFSVKLLVDLQSMDLGSLSPELNTYFTTNQYKANAVMVTGNYVDKMGNADLDGVFTLIKTANSVTGGPFTNPSTQSWDGSLDGTITNISSAGTTTNKHSVKENVSLSLFDTLDNTDRYVEIEVCFQDNSKTGETELEVHLSNIWLGVSTDLDTNGIDQKTFIYTTIDNSKTSTNKAGQRFSTEYNKQKKMVGTVNTIDATEFELLKDLFDNAGTTTPVGVILDEDENMTITDSLAKFSGLFYINKDFQFKMIAPDFYSLGFDVSQVM